MQTIPLVPCQPSTKNRVMIRAQSSGRNENKSRERKKRLFLGKPLKEFMIQTIETIYFL